MCDNDIVSSLENLGTTAVLTGAAAFYSLSRTAIEDHRVWTHRSLAFNDERAEKAYRIAGSHLTDTKRWAAVHRIHHRTPDSNLVNFTEYADYVDWHGEQTDSSEGQLELPDALYGYDPAVEEIDAATTYEIGSLARDLVGGLYQPAENYSEEEARRILYDRSPKYFYESADEMKRDRQHPVLFDPDHPPTLHQIRFLLRDPHSPALHRQGIPGILRNNVSLYGYVERNFEDGAFRPDDLQPDEIDDWTRQNRSKLRYAYVGGMMLAGVLLGGRGSKEKLATQAAIGATASALAVAGLIAGGNITNSLGHGGDMKKLTVNGFLAGKVYPKADGTYENDYHRGLGPVTLDEVGGQKVHHQHPDAIAYSLETGLNQLREAPFGTFLEYLTDHGIIFKRGDNFGNTESRPDMPSSAVQILQQYRRTAMVS